MEKVGRDAATGGGGHMGVIHVLKGSDTGSPDVRVGVMVNVRQDDEGGGGHPYGVTLSDNGEVGEVEGRRGMGDTGDGGNTTGDGYAVSGQLHRTPKVDSGAVGGPMPTSGGLNAGDRLQGGGGGAGRGKRGGDRGRQRMS